MKSEESRGVHAWANVRANRRTRALLHEAEEEFRSSEWNMVVQEQCDKAILFRDRSLTIFLD